MRELNDMKVPMEGNHQKGQGQKCELSTVSFNVDAKVSELVDLLEGQLSGQTTISVKTMNELMRQNVDGVKLEVLNEVKGPHKEKAEALGMILCQGVKRMIEFGGYEMAIMVAINFDIVEFQRSRQATHNMIESELRLEQGYGDDSVVEEPSRGEVDDTVTCLVFDKKKALLQEREERASKRASRSGRSEGERSKGGSDIELEDVNKLIEEFREEVKVAEIRKYKIAKEKFAKFVSKEKASKRKSKELLEQQGVAQLMLSRLSGYLAVMNLIVNKIKEYVRHIPEILSTVSMLVRLVGTNEMITNPYETSNLSGLVQNMMLKYFQPSFMTFQSSLLEALALKIEPVVLRSNPLKIVQDVGRIVSVWETLKFWEFMTPDMFFTTVLINALPEGTTRSSVILETARHLALLAKERAEFPEDVDPKDMSTFKFVTEYLALINVSQTKKDGGAVVATVTKDAWKSRYTKAPGSESAALAERKSEGNPPEAKFYKREVLAKENVVVTLPETGKSCGYTATKVMCGHCTHSPNCWTKACYRCGYYGHTVRICRQDPSVFTKEKAGAMMASLHGDYGAMADRRED